MNFKHIWKIRTSRIAIIVTLSVLLFFVLLGILLSPVINGIIKPRILAKLNSQNLNLQIEHAGYSILTNKVTINKLTLIQHDESDTVRIDIESADLYPDWFHFLFNNGYSFRGIEINSLFISRSTVPDIDTSGSTENKNIFSFIDSLKRTLPYLYSDYLIINNGNYVKYNRQYNLTDSIRNFNLEVNNLLLDSSTAGNSKFKIADDIQLSIRKTKLFFSKMEYYLSFNNFLLSSKNNIISLNDLSFEPYFDDNGFFRNKKFRTDRFRLSAKKFDITEFDFHNLVHNNKITANSIALNTFNFDALTNMRLPTDPKAGNPEMPNKIVNEIPFKLDIHKMAMTNGNILVKELYPYDEKPGILQFADLNADISNIKNNENVHFDISTKLTGSGKLDVQFNVSLSPGEMRFDYSGKLGRMNATGLNKFIVISDRVQIMTGDIKEVQFRINATGNTATAFVTPFYSGLSVHELNINTGKRSGIMEKINSFIANTFIIKKNNPDGNEAVQSATTVYIRKSDNAFLEYVWIALRTALGSIVGFS